jgi:hypothetical protein
VWNKGVKIAPVAKPTPTPTPTPEVTPTPEATPTPTPTPIPTTKPLQRWDESDKLDQLLTVFAERVKGIGNFQPETIFEFGKGTDPEYRAYNFWDYCSGKILVCRYKGTHKVSSYLRGR